ncbi:unnamed protein product, partial [Phaeothamnion confervicola]
LRRSFERRRCASGALAVAAVFLFVFPLAIFVDMSFGDDWTYLTVSEIKSYASSEISDAYGEVWNFAVSETLILKLFPDILIFWGAVYLVSAAALLAHVCPALHAFFRTRLPAAGGRSVGQLLLMGCFVALLLGEACYWYLDHGWHSESISSKTWQERLARTLGQLANVTMALLVLPTARNGVFETVFGVGWESLIAYHRAMGLTFMALIFAHMCLWWKVYAQNGDFAHDWPIAIPMDYNSDNFTVPLATLTYWTMLVTHGILALEWVRRRHFEVFYYAHHFFLVVWIVMLWHAQSAWYYIVASLAFWALDRAFRFSRGLARVCVADVSVCHDVVRLAYRAEAGGSGAAWLGSGGGGNGGGLPLVHGAGQYCFVNIPAISMLQWHPFSISSAPGDDVTTHHMKSMGDGTFTGRLASGGGGGWTVNVDGPYGLPLSFSRYRRVVFVAGGIGVTPCHSCIRHLAALAADGGLNDCLEDGVRLAWASRGGHEFALFADSLRAAVADP